MNQAPPRPTPLKAFQRAQLTQHRPEYHGSAPQLWEGGQELPWGALGRPGLGYRQRLWGAPGTPAASQAWQCLAWCSDRCSSVLWTWPCWPPWHQTPLAFPTDPLQSPCLLCIAPSLPGGLSRGGPAFPETSHSCLTASLSFYVCLCLSPLTGQLSPGIAQGLPSGDAGGCWPLGGDPERQLFDRSAQTPGEGPFPAAAISPQPRQESVPLCPLHSAALVGGVWFDLKNSCFQGRGNRRMVSGPMAQ